MPDWRSQAAVGRLAVAPLSVSTARCVHCDRRLNHGTTPQQLTGAGNCSDQPMWAADMFLACQEVDQFRPGGFKDSLGGQIW